MPVKANAGTKRTSLCVNDKYMTLMMSVAEAIVTPQWKSHGSASHPKRAAGAGRW